MRTANHYSAAYAVIRDGDGRILMIRRANTGYMDGAWGLPAGHVETGELPTETLVREAREEIGITVEARDVRHIHTCAYATGRQNLGLFFEIGRSVGAPVNAEPDKCSEIGFFDPDDLPSPLVPEVDSALRAIARGETFSEFRRI